MNASAKEELPATGTVRFEITPRSDYFAAMDSRGRDEELELKTALKAELPEHVRSRPGEGEKGIVTDVIMPLATGGALTAMVEAFKAWLASRPANRTIELKYEVEEKKGKRNGTLTINATNVDSAVLEVIGREALQPGK
jgi:hypothetical protein